MNKQRSGFTLLETALVVAIATLLFMAIAVGFGSRIASGRYDTAASEAADYLRDVYTEALNTENYRTETENTRQYCTLSSALYSLGEDANNLETLYFKGAGTDYTNVLENDSTALYPGRTNCAIYGKIIFFGIEDNSTSDTTDGVALSKKIHVFDIVGNAVTAAEQIKPRDGHTGIDTTTDLDLLKERDHKILEELKYVGADFRAAVPRNGNVSLGCQVAPAAGYTTYDLNWNTFPTSANYSDSTYFSGFAMIVRSPLTGDVSTLFYERPPSEEVWDLNIGGTVGCEALNNSYTSMVEGNSPVKLLEDSADRIEEYETANNKKYQTGFCLNSDDGYTSLLARRKFIEFIRNGQNASAIKLDETDIDIGRVQADGGDPREGGYNPCI